MMHQNNYIVCLLFFTLIFSSCEDKLDGPNLIKKSIAYHDPAGEWKNFQKTFYFRDKRPDKEGREYNVQINIPNSYFKYVNSGQGLVYEVSQESCLTAIGEGADCERALMMRNYYFYLWGLPMKLFDEGTLIDKEVKKELIHDKESFVVRIPYEKDVWYFYFDPEDFRMIAYKFYKDEKNQIGEIVYLENELVVGKMKIPSDRSWFRTESNEFLGTDFLLKAGD
jgi:hypothetical protein